MSEGDMKKAAEKMAEELRQLEALPEEQINTDDIPEVSDFSQAERGRFFRPLKKKDQAEG